MQFAPGLPPSDCEITRVLAHDIYKTLSRKHSKKNKRKLWREKQWWNMQKEHTNRAQFKLHTNY